MNINIEKEVTFTTTALCINGRPRYTQFPKSRGAYIFHVGNNNCWLEGSHADGKNILYIGETNKQGLSNRIGINYRGKIRDYINNKNISVSDIYVSYCVIQDEEPVSTAKLIERALLYNYEVDFNNDLPKCNNE